jgi:exosome complex component RRP46
MQASNFLSLRPDGRSSGGTLRPFSCELSPLHRADGSASFQSGSTQVLAAVYGPIAPQRSSLEKHDMAVLSIIFPGNRGDESWLKVLLEGCICTDQYRRCVIQIILQTIHDDGSLLSCALHAAISALMDAGICMKRLPLATTISLTKDGDILLDPTLEEEQTQTSVTLVSSSTNPDLVLASAGSGRLTFDRLLAVQEAASRTNPAVLAFLRLAIEQKVERQSLTLWADSN